MEPGLDNKEIRYVQRFEFTLKNEQWRQRIVHGNFGFEVLLQFLKSQLRNRFKGETKLSDNFHKKSLMLIYFDLCCYKIMVTAIILEIVSKKSLSGKPK